MKIAHLRAAVAAVIFFAGSVLVSAGDGLGPVQQSMVGDHCQQGGPAIVDCCCPSGQWFGGAEATFFKFFDSNGVEDFGGDDGEFDFDFNQRYTIGYVGCDGFGGRVRYWDYDESTLSADTDLIAVDTHTIDFELFQVIDLGCCTSIEFFGGIRYNDFVMVRDTGGLDQFDGFGGILGAEVQRDFGCGWSAYGRLREVILSDDFFASGTSNDENDTIRFVHEIALGVQYTNCNWTWKAGYEWQVWSNYSRGTVANVDEETSDVGFTGFVLGGEVAY